MATFFLTSPLHPSQLQSRYDWKKIQATFFHKTKQSLTTNLAMAENLLDFMLGTSLLVRYFSFGMRLLEGRHFASGIVHL
jgi:hypothetical protein